MYFFRTKFYIYASLKKKKKGFGLNFTIFREI